MLVATYMHLFFDWLGDRVHVPRRVAGRLGLFLYGQLLLVATLYRLVCLKAVVAPTLENV